MKNKNQKTASTKKEKGNVFDKILKENIKQIIKPFAEELLKKRIKSIKPLPAKMQTTLEIESDDFNLVETMDGEKMILHLEFELRLTKDMIYRVGEYHSVNQRKYKLPIHHYVIYLGNKNTQIRTQLHQNEVYHGFTLIRLNEKSPKDYLASDIPAMVILAILGNYPDERKNEIVRSIIKRLYEIINDKRKLSKYINQLLIFGRIRKLESIITKNVENMTSLAYDITKDGLYIRGMKEAEAKAKAEKKEVIKKLLLEGTFTQKRIAEILNVSISFIRKVKKEMSNSK